MHLPAGATERIEDGSGAVDLGQSPGDIVFLSTADTELAAFAAAVRRRRSGPTVRLASPATLAHPLSVDLYIERTLGGARLVVVRLHGGPSYWPHGLDRLRALSRAGTLQLAVIPGEDRWNPDLADFSSLPPEECHRLWRYCVEGGPANSDRALALMAHWLGEGEAPPAAEPLPRAGFYLPETGVASLERVVREAGPRPVAAILFYRALILGGSTGPVDALVEPLRARGLAALPIFVPSLRDADAASAVGEAFAALSPTVVLNGTAFAAATGGGGTILDRIGRPALQIVFSGGSEEGWRESLRGLGPQDHAMNVVMPEVDGRLLTRAVSFKAPAELDPLTEYRASTYRAVPDRVAFVADQAAAWARLAGKAPAERNIAIVLSNYPTRDGRIGNGVGLDTPESVVRTAAAMAAAGYRLAGFPSWSAELMSRLLSGATNADPSWSDCSGARLSLPAYESFLSTLPARSRNALLRQWGAPETDPHFHDGHFALALHRFGNVVVGIQPSRGYEVEPKATYHDPDLVPPHRYLAFYAWLRQEFGADAILHFGKHGNLEWLPGKAVGLSEACWPEIALGAVPVIYPFVVNDPGEGSQAKRRSSAVIVDHLTPPMTRAELHGPLARLESLIDEFYLAAGVDPRRTEALRKEILAHAAATGLDRDLGLGEEPGEALRLLDAHLCELKEMQIRDGLHVFGSSPEGRLRTDTLVAIARAARAGGAEEGASLQRAIADDLVLGFDPLGCDPAEPWPGPRPERLAGSASPWRTAGDTVERIEALASALVANEAEAADMPRTKAVLGWIARDLAPALDRSGTAEIDAVLTALDGRFVPPGPSGAPTRGRPEVLPTGRNFYSVDSRALPTEAAWKLGKAAADALALRYFQDEGEWPRSIALSAWATSNMRTGGDDIAETLALIGAEPVWEPATGRVTGFRVLPLSALGRPRVDVTLRISGMFRDAFPMQVDLIDSAVRAIAALEEPEDANPIAAAHRTTLRRMEAHGVPRPLAERQAAARVFGAKPGAYGAGLQTLIDEGAWSGRADFADAFLAWSAYAYGGGAEGDSARQLLEDRLAAADAVLHNQDNREHDILDSDDYYQFQGGLSATVETLKGRPVPLYHGDHSRPERPVVRGLAEEVARVVRGRAANPKWIAGMMRHGYKGAFEIAATVDYLFAFAATTDAVRDHHFDILYGAYLGDPAVRDFIARVNAPALAEIALRFGEAIDRGLWKPARNSAYDELSALIGARGEAAE